MLRAGDKLANYEICAALRTGGMGTLYLATRVGAAGFKQYVAIKVIHPHFSLEPKFVSSFVNEALLGARISHPNVVRVEELGEHQGAYFLVMEYIHGCSVAELFSKLRSSGRGLTAEVAVAIAARAADGLHAAHETADAAGNLLGLVHRDISPHNILVGVSGAVKLIDFGIAKAMSHDTTATGMVAGKIPYMSPEQALGRTIDRRSDVYSLAIVLWEMLTHRRMFGSRDDLGMLDLVRSPQIEPPSRYLRDLPPALDAALLSALEIDPGERTPTAREFRARILNAVPRAREVDGPHLAELIGEIMRDELVANEAVLPADVRASIPARSRRIWPRIAGGTVLAAACGFAVWALTSVVAIPAPDLESAAAPSSPPPPRPYATQSSAGEAAIVTIEAVQTVRRPSSPKHRRKAPRDPREVDGVPLLVKPDF